jgi:polysaccharide pyruvyl transferase WcaK-like protein
MRQTPAAPLELDTRLDAREALACRTAERFTSLLARVDAVVTTRLHGLVLALRAGVPAVALDPIAGGAKVAAQAAALGWPAVRTVEDTDVAQLAELLGWCLTGEARERAADCARAGRGALEQTHEQLLELLGAQA